MRDLEILSEFFSNNTNPVMPTETVNALEVLFNEYKLNTVGLGCSIISVDTGLLFGNITIHNIIDLDRRGKQELSYESDSYDYVSVNSNGKTILFTDYREEEPYNRQSIFYVGYSWSSLSLVNETNQFREFETANQPNGGSFPVWGFSFNDFWNTIQFGICLQTEKAEEFMTKLRNLLNK